MNAQVKDCPQPEYPIRERAYTPEQQAAVGALVEYSIRKRTMTRPQWVALTRGERDAYGMRESHRLPHHPDGTGYADCPDCDGLGLYCPASDPSGESDVPCATCRGDGRIPDGWRDPLVVMRATRKWRDMPASGRDYTRARSKALRPSIGMAALRMVESAIGCDLGMRELLTDWRALA